MGNLSKEEAASYQFLLRSAQPEKYAATVALRMRSPKMLEIHREFSRLMNLAFPEILAARALKWYHKDPERARKLARDRYAANPAIYRASIARFDAKNPNYRCEQTRKRRARMAGAVVEDCASKLKELNRAKKCHWCSIKLHSSNRSIDHVIPITRDGQHAASNLVASCRRCNSSKNDKLYWEWDGELAS